MKRLSTVALLGLIALGLSGCPSGSGGGGGSAGSTLVPATAYDLSSVDPALAFDTWSTSVVHACTRRLVDYDAGGELIGDLATEWKESDGGKTLTFTLRTDAKFADGT